MRITAGNSDRKVFKKIAKRQLGLCAFLAAFSLLVFCSVTSVVSHNTEIKTTSALCSGGCHTDGPAAVVADASSKESDEQEPVPPVFFAPATTVSYGIIYILSAVAFAMYAIMRKRIHLTTQLRF